MQTETPDGLVSKAEDIVRESPRGVSIQDVAQKLRVSRYQANGILGILIGSGKVGVSQIGPVKVHYWKGGD